MQIYVTAQVVITMRRVVNNKEGILSIFDNIYIYIYIYIYTIYIHLPF